MSIIVKFSSPQVMHKVNAAKKSLGLLKFSVLNKTELSSVLSPISVLNTNNDFTIYVNELLPSKAFKLLLSAKKILKPAGFKHIWARNGIVNIKKDSDSQTHTVFSTEDVQKILQLYPQSQSSSLTAQSTQ